MWNPDFLVIGHVTRDIRPDGGWQLGGSVAYAARTAQQLGLRAAIVTSGSPDMIGALHLAVPGAGIAAEPSATTTTFENSYRQGGRTQVLRALARPIEPAMIPPAWRDARIVLLAPVVHEVPPAIGGLFPRALLAATPQGWLRAWQEDGSVYPAPAQFVPTSAHRLRAVILSAEDLLPASLDGHRQPARRLARALAPWRQAVPLVVETRGSGGARLMEQGKDPVTVAGHEVREVDPTGAGDVFAAAFLCALATHHDAPWAAEWANRAAALSIEHPGTEGIPTAEMIEARFGAMSAPVR